MSGATPDTFTYRVGELIDRARAQLAQLGNSQLPLMVEGFVSFNTTTAKYDQKYFSLCQYSDANSPVGKPIAKLEAVIFSNRFAVISSQLRQVGLAFSPDLRAVFIGHLDIYKPFGKLQLVVTGIDLERTRQITEGAKDLLRAKLRAEGIFELNRSLTRPLVPLRIALVTSRGSAAESDFLTKLASEKYRFAVERFYVNTSGQNVAFSVPEALIQINSRAGDFDLVVLARGGGDHVDLANFSLEGPVRAVATCKVPVWAAIGHSTDDVLVNEVANRSLANPNDAASELNGALESFAELLQAKKRQLLDVSRVSFERASTYFLRALTTLHASASHELGRYRSIPIAKMWELRMRSTARAEASRNEVAHLYDEITTSAARRVELSQVELARRGTAISLGEIEPVLRSHSETLLGLAERLGEVAWASFRSHVARGDLVRTKLEGVDPTRVLALGYALLSAQGKRVLSVNSIGVGDRIEARLFDGSFWADVVEDGNGP